MLTSRSLWVLFAILSMLLCIVAVTTYKPPKILSAGSVRVLVPQLAPVVGGVSRPCIHVKGAVFVGSTLRPAFFASIFGVGYILSVMGLYFLARYVRSHPGTNWSFVMIFLGSYSLLCVFFASAATTFSIANPNVTIDSTAKRLRLSVNAWGAPQEEVSCNRTQSPRLLRRNVHRRQGYDEIIMVWDVEERVAGIKLVSKIEDSLRARALVEKLASALSLPVVECEEQEANLYEPTD